MEVTQFFSVARIMQTPVTFLLTGTKFSDFSALA